MRVTIRENGVSTTGSRFSMSARRTCVGAAAILLLTAAVAACGATEESPPAAQGATAEPAPAPQPAETPTTEPAPAPQPAETPSPTPAPPAAAQRVIQLWDLGMTPTGGDLATLLTPEEVTCLEGRLGANFEAMLSSPLAGQAEELLESGGSGSSPFADCLTAEHVVSARISLLSAGAGGFSTGTWDCVAGLLRENPAVVDALGRADEPAGDSSMLQLISCLTPEEAAALTPPDEGPAPDPGDISCLFEQLAGEPSGDKILDVLSGNDPTGEGLTLEESALLGQAVEACGIETGFGFPDAAGNPPSDDFGQDSMPPDIGGGTGLCTPGLILYPGDSCYYEEFSMLIRQDGSALLDGNIGGISTSNTVMDAQNIDLNGLSVTRSGTTWTIESLP